MKKAFAIGLFGLCFLFNGHESKANEFDYYSLKQPDSFSLNFYTCVNKTGQCTQVGSIPTPYGWDRDTTYVDEKNNISTKVWGELGENIFYKYNPNTNSLAKTGSNSVEDWKNNYDIHLPKNLIKVDNSGVKSIGENSLKLKETSNSQEMWATDSQGRIAPINITNGTKLLINGRDIEQSINNVGALSAALTGLPTVSTDTNLACGLGTGTHGGDFAFSGGCASKVNEKLSINYAASMTIPGQDYTGDFEDTFSARAGFVWKLGKSVNPSLISMKAKEKMEVKINALEENNKKIISQNTDLKQKNQSIISQNKALLARLERLEKIALGESKLKDLATIKLP
jgi:hypothetical protein